MNIYVFLIVASFGMCMIFAMFKWKDILNFLKPEKFFVLTIIYNDGTIGEILHYRKDMSAIHVNIEENMYLFTKKNVYRSGRNNAYFYNEGKPKPISLNDDKQDTDSKALDRFNRISLLDLFTEKRSPVNEFLENNKTIILVIIGALVIFFLYQNSQGVVIP